MAGNPIRYLSIRRQSRALPVLADFGQSEFHIDGSFIENEFVKNTRPIMNILIIISYGGLI